MRLTAGQAGTPEARRRGFTLAELLIAIAILGVGLSMIASVFPAALRQGQRSTEDVYGTLICRNAIEIAKARLRHTAAPNPFHGQGNLVKTDLGADAQYAGTNTAGFILLGRQMPQGPGKDENDYQLVAVAYRKWNAANTVNADTKSNVVISDGTGDNADRSEAVFPDANDIQIGSPVVVTSSGQYAMILLFDPTTRRALLDRKITAGTFATFVVAETGGPQSPAVGVLAVRTALRD